MAAPTNHEFLSKIDKLTDFMNCFDLNYIDCKTKIQLVDILKVIASDLKYEDNRRLLPSSTVEFVAILAEKSLPVITEAKIEEFSSEKFEPAITCLRFLRNCCAGCPAHQATLNRCEHLIDASVRIFQTFLLEDSHTSDEKKAVSELQCCCMQFFGNAVSGCESNAKMIWNKMTDTFRQILMNVKMNVPLYHCTLMVFYNCLNTDRVHDLLSTEDGPRIVLSVLDNIPDEASEYGLFIIEKLLTEANSLQRIWSTSTLHQREVLMEIVSAQIEKSDAAPTLGTLMLDESNVDFVGDLFVICVNSIVSDVVCDLDRNLLFVLLECLCTASALFSTYTSIRNKSSLLQSTIDLLRFLHHASSQSTTASQLQHDGLIRVGSTGVESTGVGSTGAGLPGLKRDLVRLVANLVYANTANQNLVREMNAIPLLLDQTTIDLNNPFMVQWALLAVRNLCDRNDENKQFLAGLKMDRLPEKIQILNDLDSEMRLENGKIVVQKTKHSDERGT